jgi:hypothetical protein
VSEGRSATRWALPTLERALGNTQAVVALLLEAVQLLFFFGAIAFSSGIAKSSA